MLLYKRTQINKKLTSKLEGIIMNNERQLKIFDIISKKGNVSVEDLSDMLKVSKMTIRRDLEKLQEDNLLKRTHGGAIANKVLLHEVAYNKKREKNLEIKQKLANEAAEYIQPNSTIYLDAGTTTFEVALKLTSLSGLTIITNDIMIASQLYSTNNTVILLGGLIQRETGSITGQYALDMLDEFNIDLAVMAVSSVDSNMVMCTPDLGKQQLKRKVIQVSEKSILIADASKFFQKSLYRIGPIQTIDIIITDLDINKLNGINMQDCQVITIN